MKWSLDQQRTYVCIVGLILLTASLVLSAFDREPSGIFLGIFASMVVGPILEGTVQRYRKLKNGGEDEGQ